MRTVKLGWSCFSAFVLTLSVWVVGQANPSAALAATGQIVLRSTPLGPMPADTNQLSITPDGQHIMVAGNTGTRRDVFIDGNEGSVYSALMQMPSLDRHGPAGRLLMISPDGMRFAYVAKKGTTDWVMVVNQKESPVFDGINGAFFSPVGHRLMYIASKGGKQMVVVDATVSAAYQRVALPQFNADGTHFGFVAQLPTNPITYCAVVDDKEGPHYDTVGQLVLSRSGRIAYVANNGSSLTPLQRQALAQQAHATDVGDTSHMVVDGQVGPNYPVIQQAVFSADGSHVAYIACKTLRPEKWVAVIDGQEQPEFDRISNVILSPDGKHSVYTATEATGGRYANYAVVDGKKSLDYAGCTDFVFSPDSQHLAYVASSNKAVVVLDGKEGDAHDSILLPPAAFSPDSKRFAYIAQDKNKMYLVLDGKAGPAQPSIDPRSLQFTPDSQHCRFKVGMSADASFYAMDDQSVESAGSAMDLAATADGRHTAIAAAKDVGTGVQTCRVSLDGKPMGETYQGIQSLQISADGAHVAYIGLSNGSEKKNAHAVFDGHEGPAYFRIDKLILSPDGQHMAYACTEDGSKHYVVVDSFLGPEYNDVCLGTTGQYEGMQFTKDGSLSFLPVKDGKLSHVIMGPDAIAAIPKPGGGAGAPATSAPPGYSKVYTFGSIPKDGATPAVLTAAPDGTLYGATSGGGKYQMGVLFKCDADGGNYKILHNWAGTVDGAYPSSIRVGPDGAVYGSLQVQGKKGHGAIYRCSADGADFKVLHSFSADDKKDGASPIIMTIDPDGTICGISGPTNAPINIFRMSPDGSSLKLIFNSARSTGGDQHPIGRFTDGGDGYYYGAAGTTLFKLKKDGTDYSVLRKFEGAPTDAARADYAPILASDGKLYGIDNDGGQGRGGTIFTLARDGSGYKLLVDPDAGQLLPTALVEGTDGKLYAFVQAGFVRYNKDGSGYEVLQPNPTGGYRWTALVHGGAFYGIADQGPNRGMIFRYGMGGAAGGGANAAPTAVVQNVPPAPLDANVDLPGADALPK